jgi:alpha-galactosidase
VGISEIKHIEGLYAFWDSLLVRFPKLLIDNCASGGRRLDLETTSRSAPLWRTDYQYGEPNGYQCHTYGLNFYLPIHGTAIYKTDGYTFRSGLGGTAVMNWEVTGKNSEPIPAIQKRIQDYKNIRPFFYADYYPLTASENNTSDDVWLAYQLNRPKENDGVVIAFRRNNCPDESITVKLRGLDKAADYELTDDDTGIKIIQKGEVLCDGFMLSLSEKQKSLQIGYHLIKN